jgi:hypothetical protein
MCLSRFHRADAVHLALTRPGYRAYDQSKTVKCMGKHQQKSTRDDLPEILLNDAVAAASQYLFRYPIGVGKAAVCVQLGCSKLAVTIEIIYEKAPSGNTAQVAAPRSHHSQCVSLMEFRRLRSLPQDSTNNMPEERGWLRCGQSSGSGH